MLMANNIKNQHVLVFKFLIKVHNKGKDKYAANSVLIDQEGIFQDKFSERPQLLINRNDRMKLLMENLF